MSVKKNLGLCVSLRKSYSQPSIVIQLSSNCQQSSSVIVYPEKSNPILSQLKTNIYFSSSNNQFDLLESINR